jgi:hypothetical protein
MNVVQLNEEEVKQCRDIASMEGRDKSTTWTENEYLRGFLGTASTFMGVVGEFLVDKVYFQQGVDKSVSEIGDGGWDILRLDKKIDAKLQKAEALWAIEKRKVFGGFYVVATDKYNREKELKYDLAFFSTVDAIWSKGQRYDDWEIKNNFLSPMHWGKIEKIDLELCGFIWKEDILKNKEERKAPTLMKSSGSGYNYYIKREELYLPESTKEFDEILTRGYVNV